MDDPVLHELGRHVQPDWSGPRADRVRRRIARKGARRRLWTVAGGVAIAAAFALVAARLGSARAPVASPIEPAKIAPAPVVPEATKTTATPLSADAKVEPEGESGRAYVLHAGAARFIVEHDEQHPFTVRAGDVLVEDVGTVFTVAYAGSDRVEVSVTHGSVRVNHDGTTSSLSAGEHLDVPAHAAGKPPASVQERARPARDDVAALLRAADDARADGRPQAALDPLRRVIKEHASDSRAGLAAFTLGRVLLDELNRPSEAADAFATARAHGGPMAADSLGREVVARARAGETSRAAELANEYLRLYPRGDRAREVERFASGR